jgi:hypothetical protein
LDLRRKLGLPQISGLLSFNSPAYSANARMTEFHKNEWGGIKGDLESAAVTVGYNENRSDFQVSQVLRNAKVCRATPNDLPISVGALA